MESNVKLATLALVIEQPGHGMDVAKRFTARFGMVMRSGPSHIYAALKSLEDDRAVERPTLTPEEDQQRVAYRATRRGVERWRTWLSTPPSGYLSDVVVRMASTTDPALLLGLLDDYERIALQEARLLPAHSPHLGEQLLLDEAKAFAEAHVEFVSRARVHLTALLSRR